MRERYSGWSGEIEERFRRLGVCARMHVVGSGRSRFAFADSPLLELDLV